MNRLFETTEDGCIFDEVSEVISALDLAGVTLGPKDDTASESAIINMSIKQLNRVLRRMREIHE
ncbi:hypothetical protein [Yersinia bercovieri]|uniref:hypothetical protein n=1 Tax=Yersinia bercovieri TaxID=634 RepID=UPI0005E5DF69|nr:hypothetical protein [Yersinia bercovieri]CNJ11219.1 Uncharacterised protein [Yersinia bercovieri]